MKKNILLKVLILVFAFIMVIFAVQFINSPSFKSTMKMFFGEPAKTFSWCPAHTTDFKWESSDIKESIKTAKPTDLVKKLCNPPIEPIQNVEFDKLTFTPLVSAITAEAKIVTLEWNPENQIFKSEGMPFKSSSLIRELLDESK